MRFVLQMAEVLEVLDRGANLAEVLEGLSTGRIDVQPGDFQAGDGDVIQGGHDHLQHREEFGLVGGGGNVDPAAEDLGTARGRAGAENH